MTIAASPPKKKVSTTEEKIQNVVDGIRRFSYTTPYEVESQLKKIVKNEELAQLKKGIVARAAARGKTLSYDEITTRLTVVEKATDWTSVGFTQRYADLERKFLAKYHCQSPNWPIIPMLIKQRWSLRPVS